MSKTHTTLTIDQDILDKAKAMQLNISGEFQKFLDKLILTYNHNIEGVNLELLNIEIIKLKNTKIKIDMELQTKLRQKEVMEEVIKKKEEDELKQQKENIEKQSQCQQCKRVLGDKEKKHSFLVGIICNSCFLSSDSNSIKRWNNG